MTREGPRCSRLRTGSKGSFGACGLEPGLRHRRCLASPVGEILVYALVGKRGAIGFFRNPIGVPWLGKPSRLTILLHKIAEPTLSVFFDLSRITDKFTISGSLRILRHTGSLVFYVGHLVLANCHRQLKGGDAMTKTHAGLHSGAYFPLIRVRHLDERVCTR
jgi:hypothetical protein